MKRCEVKYPTPTARRSYHPRFFWYWSSVHICQSHGWTGPEISHQDTEDPYCFLSYVNVFEAYILSSLDILFGLFFALSHNIVVANLWTPWWRLQLDILNSFPLLVVGRDAFDVIINASSTLHENVGCEVFWGWPLKAGEIIEHYYGSLILLHLAGQNQGRNSYGNGVMSVNIKDFAAWAYTVSETFLDRTGKEGSE